MVNTAPEPAAPTPPSALPRPAQPEPPLPPVPLDLQAAVLRDGYRCGQLKVVDVIDAVLAAIAARGDDGVWIHVAPRAELLARAAELDALATAAPNGALPPLFGLPFAVKDNIDVAGMPTTAACPSFGYPAAVGAPLVEKLLEAGAVCVGKTNLDQFATGLSGVRSPYGIPTSPFDPLMISGGSSSGSAVAVAAGLVTFAIGTDTAGSGRVPAALTNTVGIKPSRGLVSSRGMVPACRSLDCPTVAALSVADGSLVLDVISGFDADDPWSRRFGGDDRTGGAPVLRGTDAPPVRLGIPTAGLVAADCDDAVQAVFATALGLLTALGAELVEIDLEPFLEAGRLLYDGPWLAERYAAVGSFLEEHPDAVHPVVAELLAPGARISGVEVFTGIDRLWALRRRAEAALRTVDALVLPTVPRTFSVADMLADPIRHNARLGRYTTFVNLLDLAAVAVPVGFSTHRAGSVDPTSAELAYLPDRLRRSGRNPVADPAGAHGIPAGLPYGVSLIGPAGSDARLAAIATSLHARSGLAPGLGTFPLATAVPTAPGHR